jgi:hypothetical protein
MPKAIIIGASPIGLAVAQDMLRLGIRPNILEPSGSIADRPSLNPRSFHFYPRNLSVVIGELYLHFQITTIYFVRDEICSVHAVNNITGELRLFTGEFFFSSFPLAELLPAMRYKVTSEVPDARGFRNLVLRESLLAGV